MKLGTIVILGALLLSGSARHDGNTTSYDRLIHKYSTRYFDFLPGSFYWMKAKVWAESRFDPRSTSRVGARGLLQLMPGTLQGMTRNPSCGYDPDCNLRVGMEFQRVCWNDFEYVRNDVERKHFADAAYNSGPGNILRATLATKYSGGDPGIWFGQVERHLVTRPSARSETIDYVYSITRKERELEALDAIPGRS